MIYIFMEKELKNKARKSVLVKALIGVMCGGLLSLFLSFNKTLMIVLFLLVSIVSVIYVIRELWFIRESRLTFGKIIKVEKSDPNNSQAYQNYIIEYFDKESEERLETIVYEQFGDNDEDQEENIKEFFKEGQRKIGKDVPLLYLTKKPEKTYVSFNIIE